MEGKGETFLRGCNAFGVVRENALGSISLNALEVLRAAADTGCRSLNHCIYRRLVGRKHECDIPLTKIHVHKISSSESILVSYCPSHLRQENIRKVMPCIPGKPILITIPLNANPVMPPNLVLPKLPKTAIARPFSPSRSLSSHPLPFHLPASPAHPDP